MKYCDKCGKEISSNYNTITLGRGKYTICSKDCMDEISKSVWETRCETIEGNIHTNFEKYDVDLYNCFQPIPTFGVSKLLIFENEVHIHYTSGKMVIFREGTL